VFNDHDTSISKELLWIVVDELSVDEDIWLILKDLFDLSLHLLFFGLLDLRDFQNRVDFDFSSHDFDLIGIHLGVSDHNFWVDSHSLASSSNLFLEDETISQVRVSKGATWLLDDLDVVHVSGSLKSQDGVDGQLCELFSLRFQKLGTEGGHGDVHQILLESNGIIKVIESIINQDFLGDLSSLSPSLNNDLWVNLGEDKLFSFSKQLSGKYCDGGGTISDFLILSLGDINQNLGCGVINKDRLQNGGTIIGNYDSLSSVLVSEGLQDFIHTLWTKSGLNKVSDGNSSNKRLLNENKIN
jgi:hypothetical protein